MIIFVGATTFSITLSIVGISLVVFTISAGIVCAISLGSKVLHKLNINKFNKYRKQYEKDQQTNESIKNLCIRSLQDNVFDENECESQCKIFNKYLNGTKTKNESFFINMNKKSKIDFFK